MVIAIISRIWKRSDELIKIITIFSFILGPAFYLFGVPQNLIAIIYLCIFIFLIIYAIWKSKAAPVVIPLMFEREVNNSTNRVRFNDFLENAGIKKYVDNIEKQKGSGYSTNLIMCPDIGIVKNSNPDEWDSTDWKNVIENLFNKWKLVDKDFMGIKDTRGRKYLIYLHSCLAISCALGAYLNFRRHVVLYENGYNPIFDIPEHSEISTVKNKSSVEPPTIQPSNLDIDEIGKKDKLIIHIIISRLADYSPTLHPDYEKSENIALIYGMKLNTKKSWWPYVQHIMEKVNPIIKKYTDNNKPVDVCFGRNPEAFEFVIGMALSLKPVTVCHFNRNKNQYVPLFSLKDIKNLL